MSHVARGWLQRASDAAVIAVDASDQDEHARRFFSAVADRIEFVNGDILDPALWQTLAARDDVGFVVHGATVTSIDRLVHAGGRGKPGLSGARKSIDVNVEGTLNVLQWAVSLPNICRLVNVSSGSVYASDGPEPLPEEGFVAPNGIYAITKYAGEMFTDYAARHLGLPAVSVRLSGVFGPMDRETKSRSVRSAPRAIAERAVAGKTVRVRSLDAAGDYVHAGDVADAIIALLNAQMLSYGVYNVAAGRLESIRELMEAFRRSLPSLRFEEVGEGADADVSQDPNLTRGRFGAYDISRIQQDTGWRPRRLVETVEDYVSWLKG